ncbi:conserved hypothetical protein [Mesorhizobium plurifarium]|uniref:Uncharacterized protein n=1 Tax=Mesorhizobium plurifarium TaxID=69974 RepID=A0A0K2W011_MESPL|nr:conserved hypothetical protein [Mesorhizobium plurifarium]
MSMPAVLSAGAVHGLGRRLSSGDDVGDDAVFQRRQPVFQHQLLFLHALDLKRVAACGDHRVDGGVEIGVFLFEPGIFEAYFSLFLFGHYLPFCVCIAQSGWLGGTGW